MGNEVDFYKILQSERTASSDELKKNYQRLVLTLHPDKTGNYSKNEESFLLLQKAWMILRDPKTRKQYDAELSCDEHNNCLLYDTIELSDMDYNSSELLYSYPCRCGGTYLLESSNSDVQKVIIPCDECSFSVQVYLNQSS